MIQQAWVKDISRWVLFSTVGFDKNYQDGLVQIVWQQLCQIRQLLQHSDSSTKNNTMC